MVKSVYIHIPFCKNICSYCDFCKMYYNKSFVDQYLDKLKEEIISNYKGEVIDTIYLGGGTPSCLNNEQLNYLFEITNIFNKSNNLEFTIEMNPEDIVIDKIKILKKYGVNRISIGNQTFNKKFLKYLNRYHEYEDIKSKINLLKENGFNNINIDLIYAIKDETIENLKDDLDKIKSLDINHISCYSLMIEENTKLYIDKNTSIDENIDYEMYKYIEKYLESIGFNHYEISNYSKKISESKHNLTYWNNLEYYGFGLSASGYIDNVRYTNTKNLSKYLKSNEKEEIYLNKNDIISYEMILGLRKFKGINKRNFKKKYGLNIDEYFDIDDLLKNKELIDDGEYIYINKDYMYVSNNILINFVGDSDE